MDAELEKAKAEISNAVYAAASSIFETYENTRQLHGNGHHMAQQIAAAAEKLLEERWIKKDGAVSTVDAMKAAGLRVAPQR